MQISFKKGVTMQGVQPETVLAIMAVNGVYTRLGYKHTVTSITDGQHSEGSLHYPGFAFDNRTWADDQGTQLSYAVKKLIAAEIRKVLTDEFDVVVESTHIHVEHDPD